VAFRRDAASPEDQRHRDPCPQDRGPPVALPARVDCFVRAQVVTSSGAVVAFGQPVWMLRAAPPSTGIPPRRQFSP
jgi:hypothetical protein